ncbi:uncharacterized protein B0T23DRAFT_375850 [Neurospora hispaniola]|uniref:Uncharacterized protein n=1 Tax=Neurospora hispaniola TaxID=588809 RepID=A0AAJ0IE96_9PEZI|nr:hypothetical protein B0T23DRAFT_375850 [Neurospora hispaniola]
MSLFSFFLFFSFHLQRPETERNRGTRKGAPCARPPIFHISTTCVTITRLNLDCGSQPANEFEHHWAPRFLLVKKRKANGVGKSKRGVQNSEHQEKREIRRYHRGLTTNTRKPPRPQDMLTPPLRNGAKPLLWFRYRMWFHGTGKIIFVSPVYVMARRESFAISVSAEVPASSSEESIIDMEITDLDAFPIFRPIFSLVADASLLPSLAPKERNGLLATKILNH